MNQTSRHRQGLTRDSTIAIVLLLLFLLAIAGFALVPYVRPEQYTATALFNVSTDELFLVDDRPFDQRVNNIFRKTQVAYLNSYFVLQSALREPGLAALSILAPHEDKVKWLQDNLDVGYEGQDSEILHIRLRGTEEQSEDLRKIVDAVCDAYMEEVVFDEDQRRLVARDAIVRASEALRKKIESLIDKRIGIRNELKANSSSSSLETAQTEIDALNATWRNLLVSIETDKVEANAPDRIRRIQKALVTSEDQPEWWNPE